MPPRSHFDCTAAFLYLINGLQTKQGMQVGQHALPLGLV